jgi:hypothetical protein
MSNPTIIFTTEPVDVVEDYETDELFVIHTPSLRDYDYASEWMRRVLDDGNLSGPEQMRLVIELAQRFLSAYGEDRELFVMAAGEPA